MEKTVQAKIHPTAIVHPGAQIAEGVEIGPYAIVEGDVSIGAGTQVDAHAVIRGHTQIGKENKIGIGAVIGLEPQDISYKGQKTFVKIGDKNIIREYVQVHRGAKEGSSTEIGNGNFLMGFVHVAHNCHIANGVILANGVLLAGHVEIADFAFISGHCIIHQFNRVGAYVMMRGASRVSLDIPPYCIADDTNALRTINTVGLERRGFTTAQIREIKNVYKQIFYSTIPLNEHIQALLAKNPSQEIRVFLEFIQSSKIGICRPPTS